MEKEKCKFCFPLCDILTSAINIRFKEEMENENFLLAANSHPKLICLLLPKKTHPMNWSQKIKKTFFQLENESTNIEK